ncbi:unnamed protein product [Gordionus sp. m RMFG-2023]
MNHSSNKSHNHVCPSCCGNDGIIKKQKINNFSPANQNSNNLTINGNNWMNGYSEGCPKIMNMSNHLSIMPNGQNIVHINMCFYCFDVLKAHLNGNDIPKSPNLPRDN